MSNPKERSTVPIEFMIAVRQKSFLEETARELRMSLSDLIRGILTQAIKTAIEAKAQSR